MGEATLNPEVCANLPRWMLKNGATAKYLGVAETAFKFLPLPIERGRKVEAPHPYGPHQYYASTTAAPKQAGRAKKTSGIMYSAAGRQLPTCFASVLANDDKFKQWIQLSSGRPLETWMQDFFATNLDGASSRKFDRVCRRIMMKLLAYTGIAITKRKSKNTDYSFEFQLHCFHRSTEFDDIIKDLPGNLSQYRPGCVVLCMILAEMHQNWLTMALEQYYRKTNPALRTKLKAGADKKRKSVESATVTPGLATAKKARNEEAESDAAEANVNIENITR
ncbi:hypothetical protein THAOC_04576 [Thalassiosira oceanica]|uniref:Uncharacterized protein n=1 Tax=Thalassiosira oceanica TaxID=159749 RepID=K0TNT1_THAOC|nr:hypothetical protein THAOC_04576 [Thalassiosira oceanica]|eukprot:EJK73782.1 hypothetical protein THAOC_04576 [Thalassiosira oceanica]